MPTVADLGRAVKAKYPEYNDLTDEQVGRLVKQKYPGAYDDYEDTSLSLLGPNSLDYYPDQKLEAKIQQIWNRHEPGMGNVVSWWRRRKLDGQNRFLESANEQQRLLIEQASIIAEAYANRQRSEAEFRIFVARNAAELHLMGEAAQHGMTIPDWSAYNRERQQHEMRLKEIKVSSEARVYEEAQISEIRLREQRLRREFELEARGTEYEQDQANIDRAVLSPSLLEEEDRQHLYRLYDEREALKASDDPAKGHKLRAVELAIRKKEAKLFGE